MAVAGDFAVDQVNDVLGNVGGMVGNPFDVARGGVKVKGGVDVRGICLYEIVQIGNQLAVEIIDDVVAPAHFARRFDVEPHKSV